MADLLHESELETTTTQVSTKSVSVSDPGVTLSDRTRYTTSSRKGNTLPTMTHSFGPVGSVVSGSGKGLVTLKTNLYVYKEGKMVQVKQSKTEDIETVTDPKYGGSVGNIGKIS